MSLLPGDEIRIRYKDGRKKIVKECKIINVVERFILVQYENYRTTIDRFLIDNEKVQVEMIKKAS